MIKLAQSTINEDERKRILYQSLMVCMNFNFHCLIAVVMLSMLVFVLIINILFPSRY